MQWLPYRALELRSTLTAGAAREALANQVEPKRWFRFGSGSRPFEGSVEEAQFEIQRIMGYRNSFLPQIRGEIRADVAGCTIQLTMKPHPFVTVFMGLWATALLAFSLPALISVASATGAGTAAAALIPLGMLLFGVVLGVGAFSFEARKAEGMLKDILSASSTQPD